MRRSGIIGQARRGPSATAAVLLAVAALLGAMPTVVHGIVAPPPTLWSWDAPYTRHQTVAIAFIPGSPWISGSAVRYRLANDPTEGSSGILLNGTDVPVETDWTLTSGLDGPRVVYGQVQDEDGTWTDSAPLEFDLHRAGSTVIAIDADRGFLVSPDGVHEVIDGGATPVSAGLIPSGGPGSPPLGIQFLGGGWDIRFGDTTSALAAGTTYTFADSIDPAPGPFADIHHSYECSGSGSFTIREIVYSPDGDLERAAVDFTLCSSIQGSVSGSIRYGSNLGYAAMGQSTDVLVFPSSGILEVGQTSAPASVTLRNDGTSPTTLGTAAIVSDAADDFSLVADSCSTATLQIGETCTMSVRAHPTLRGQRYERLEVADDTLRGKRSITLILSAMQPTTTTLDVTLAGAIAPTSALAVLTIAPAPDAAVFRLDLDGEQVYAPDLISVTELTDPSRLEVRYSVPLGAGDHVFFGQFLMGEAGNYLDSSAPPITVHVDPGVDPPDLDPPIVTAPTHTLASGQIGTQYITWGATDAGSGLASIALERSVDGGPFIPIAASSLHDATVILAAGHAYQLRVRATDLEGHTSAWSTSSGFGVRSYQESSGSISFGPAWTRRTNPAYWGGAEKWASQAGAKATFSFTGRSFEWVGVVGPTRGKAQILIDGHLVATIDLHAVAAAGRRVLFVKDWGTSAKHKVVIKVLGTTHHSMVDLDAFLTSN